MNIKVVVSEVSRKYGRGRLYMEDRVYYDRYNKSVKNVIYSKVRRSMQKKYL